MGHKHFWFYEQGRTMRGRSVADPALRIVFRSVHEPTQEGCSEQERLGALTASAKALCSVSGRPHKSVARAEPKMLGTHATAGAAARCQRPNSFLSCLLAALYLGVEWARTGRRT